MKEITLSCFLMCLRIGLFAQQNGGVIMSRDTINISGYVYDYDGTPNAGVVIYSQQKDTTYNLINLQTITDLKGFFKMNGVLFNDTLMVGGLWLYNKGSRYIVINMPSETRKLNIPYKVTAVRTHPKTPTKFIIKPYKRDNINKIFGDSEFDPRYPGGPLQFQNDILKKLVYPQRAVENNIEGTVEVVFSVLRDGRVSNYKILKGLGYGCDAEIIEVMKAMPKWTPGIQNGRPVEISYVMDIEFKLTDN